MHPCLLILCSALAGAAFLALVSAFVGWVRDRKARPPRAALSPAVPVYLDLPARDASPPSAPGQTFWGGAYDDEMRPESRVPGHLFAAPEPRRYPPEAPTAPVRRPLSADAPTVPLRPPLPPTPATTVSTTRSRVEGLRDGVADPDARRDLDEALDRDLKEGTWPKSQAVPTDFRNLPKKGDFT